MTVITLPRTTSTFYAISKLVILRLVTLYRALRWALRRRDPNRLCPDDGFCSESPRAVSRELRPRNSSRFFTTDAAAQLLSSVIGLSRIRYANLSCSRVDDLMSLSLPKNPSSPDFVARPNRTSAVIDLRVMHFLARSLQEYSTFGKWVSVSSDKCGRP